MAKLAYEEPKAELVQLVNNVFVTLSEVVDENGNHIGGTSKDDGDDSDDWGGK